jgi:hypothetical protein
VSHANTERPTGTDGGAVSGAGDAGSLEPRQPANNSTKGTRRAVHVRLYLGFINFLRDPTRRGGRISQFPEAELASGVPARESSEASAGRQECRASASREDADLCASRRNAVAKREL